MEKPKRILYYDLLNIAACMAVIALHHNGLVHNFTGDSLWKQCLFAEVAFYWAVPVFLMLSRSHTDGITEEIFHICVFQEKTDKGGLSMAFLDAVSAGVEDTQPRICVGELYSKRTD